MRFMTSHPKDASDRLIEVMAKHENIAKHFHLPLQSGSDSILRKMNRHYDSARYLSIIDKLRAEMPDISITTDIIVGFPGETEEDFEDTLNMLKKVRFDMIYSFIFSPRKGTPAAEMENQIPEKVKSERFQRLLDTQNEISREKNEECIGRIYKVLSEGRSKTNPDVCSGRTDGNKLVHFVSENDTEGSFINVKITRADTFTLYGDVVK